MLFPKRHQSHVTETASFKRFDQCIPAHWIMRHVSERDYGLDCLIEPILKPDGPVKGDLLAVQLKGTESITWAAVEDRKDKRTVFSGTDVTTVNYWMGLPVPVFLCVHEQTSNSVFFAPVKHQVRRRYRELQSQKTFGFELIADLDLAATHGVPLLYALYLRERSFAYFAEALTDLLVHWDAYAEYIEENVERDCFLEVESPELVQLFRLYQHTQTVAAFTGIEWNVTPLHDLIEEDQHVFKDAHTILHERTHGHVLRELAPVFVEALRKGVALVGEVERDYWESEEFLLVRYISERRTKEWLNEVEQRLSPQVG